MKLNKAQADSLRRLQRYRTHPPSLQERLRLVARFAVALLVIVVLLGAVFVWLEVPGALFLLAGLYLGAVAREIGQQRLFIEWWPLNRQITHWEKVDEILTQTEDAPVDAIPAPAPKTNWKRAAVTGVALFAVIFGAAVAVERALAVIHDPTRNNPRDNVIILTASWCGYCMSLRQHLTELNVRYTDLDVEHTTEGRWAFNSVRGTGVPITIVGDQVIRGVGRDGMRWGRIDDALLTAGYPARGARAQSAAQREGDWESSEIDP